MEILLKTPITLFVRVKGEKGERELLATLSTGSTHVMIPVKDALSLGYDAYFDPWVDSDRGVQVVTAGTMIVAKEIVLQEVGIGELTAKNVEAIVYEPPEPGGVDVILGTSFLKNFKTTIDYGRGILKIENIEEKPKV